jgi:hypothetical protein
MESPVLIEIAVGDHGAKLQDGLGSGQSPPGSGDLQAVIDQIPGGPSTTPVAIGQPCSNAWS